MRSLVFLQDELIWKEVSGFEAKPRTVEFVNALPPAAREHYMHFAYFIGTSPLVYLPLRHSILLSTSVFSPTCQLVCLFFKQLHHKIHNVLRLGLELSLYCVDFVNAQ